MYYKFRFDGEVRFADQVIMLRKIVRISTEIVECQATFRDMRQSLLSYARAYKEDYGIPFVDMRMMDIVEDEMI